MTKLHGIRVNCTIVSGPLNGRIRAAINTNTKPFIGQPVAECAAKVLAQAHKSVVMVRRHLKYSIEVAYDKDARVLELTVQSPGKAVIPLAQSDWFLELKKEAEKAAKKKTKNKKKPKSKKQKDKPSDKEAEDGKEETRKPRRKPAIERGRAQPDDSGPPPGPIRNDWRRR